MSKFFDLWSSVNVVLGDFDDFYYAYLKMIKSVENECGMKISEIKADDYNRNETFILEKISEFSDRYRDNDYYIVLLKNVCDARPILIQRDKSLINSNLYIVLHL